MARGDSQLLAVLLLLLLGQTVLRLRNLELSVPVQRDEADSQVGSSQVEGEVLADLFASGPLFAQQLSLSMRTSSSLRQKRKWELRCQSGSTAFKNVGLTHGHDLTVLLKTGVK